MDKIVNRIKSGRYDYKNLPYMDAEGRKYYRKLCKILTERDDFWSSDRDLLAVLAQSYSDYDRLTEIIIQEGEFYVSGKRKYQHPASAARENAVKHIKEICGHFRLAPKFRGKTEGLNPERELDDIDKL